MNREQRGPLLFSSLSLETGYCLEVVRTLSPVTTAGDGVSNTCLGSLGCFGAVLNLEALG